VRRLGAPPAFGLLPAAFGWFGGDVLYLEHLLMADSLYLFGLALAVDALAFATQRPSGRRWLLAGALALLPGLVRSTGLVLLPVAAAWAVIVTRPM
jgi:Gpi18-like mannosyltransferase